MAMRIFEAMEGICMEVPRSEACGKISADFYTVYPPGIPVIVPGERITEEMLMKVKDDTFFVVAEKILGSVENR